MSDGDTLTVQNGEKRATIRLCGIDAPEVAHGHGLGQPLGEEAKETLRSLLQAAGKQVIVVPLEQDRYGRTVGEVFVKVPTAEQPEQEQFINYEMVASGMAYEYTRYSGSCPNREAIAKGEVEARRQHRGVWANPNAIKPWDYRRLKK